MCAHSKAFHLQISELSEGNGGSDSYCRASQLIYTPDYNGSLVLYKVLKFIKFQFNQTHGQNLAWNQNEHSYFAPEARTSPLQFNLAVLRVHANNCPQPLPQDIPITMWKHMSHTLLPAEYVLVFCFLNCTSCFARTLHPSLLPSLANFLISNS